MNQAEKIHPVHCNRIFFFVVMLGLAARPAIGSFQDRRIEVQPASGSRIEALPGGIVTVSMRVSNRSTTAVRLESSVILPPGWRSLRKETPYELAPGASDIRLISFAVPAETPADQYEIRYTVTDQAAPTTAAEASVTVVITAVRQLELRLLDLPRYIIAGDRYSGTFVITNRGNVRSKIRLVAKSGANFVVRLDSSVVELRPNEAREIRALVQTDPEAIQKVQDVLEIHAIREGESAIAARASGAVEVVPRVSGLEDAYVRFPLQLRVRAAGEQTTRGVQVEFTGSGALGEGRQDRFDLLVRTPDIQPRSILGQRDEYRISYLSDQYEIYVGDRNYSLSPLTEYNRYAFGGGGKATLGRFTLGGFYNETRFLRPRQKEYAGFLSYRPVEGSEVALNYLGKPDLTKSDIVTVRTLLRPIRSSEVDFEYGRASAGSIIDKAYAARVAGREPWIAYEARYVRAGPRYTGYFKDLEFKTLSLNVMPWRNFRIEGYFRDEKRNLERDTSLFLAPRERYYQVGAGYSDLLAVYYRFSHQDDLLPKPKYRRDEEMVQVRMGHTFPSFGLIANADFGTTRDTVAGKDYPFQRYTVFSSFRPTDGSSIGMSVEYSKDQNIFTDEVQKRLSGSLSAWLMLGRQTQLIMTAYGSRVPDSTKQSYYLLDLTLEHTFSFGHRLALRGRQSEFTPTTDGKDLAYALEYSIPLGVPLSRMRTIGQLRGRVVDVETGRGLANVLIYATGFTAITDRDGEFSFPSLKPDKYYIQMDMASIGLNRVPSQPMPREVTIQGGEEARLDLGVVRGAVISGTVLIYGTRDTVEVDSARTITVEIGGHPNVILELSNSLESHRRLSDNRGRFTFSGVRPGRWVLQVLEGNLPANHYIERESFEVELMPGGTQQALFKILPRKRRIQIVQEGGVLQETKAADRRRPVTVPARPPTSPPARPQPERAVAVRPQVPPVQPTPVRTTETSYIVLRIPGESAYTIQTSSWPGEDRARREAERLEQMCGYQTFVDKVDLPSLRVRYRVYVGRFSTKRLAELAAEELRKKLAQQ